MKSTALSRLDQATPRWPEIVATFSEDPTVTVGGVSQPLTSDDIRAELVGIAATQAQRQNKPIRVTVNGSDGTLTRLIVTPETVVHKLETLADSDAPTIATPQEPASSEGMKKKSRRPHFKRDKKSRQRAGSSSTATPAKLLKWVLIGLGGSIAALVVILVVKGLQGEETAPPVAQQNTVERPAPPAARIYTEVAPPGWSQQAWWALPIAADTQPITDAGSGATVIVSSTDNAQQAPTINPDGDPTQHEPAYLSVVDKDGRGLWSAPLADGRPRIGPIITTIDGARVVMTGDGPTLTYWPLAGGQATVVELPDDAASQINASGESPLITLDDDRLGYLADGAMQIVQVLPRTEPVFALDGAVVLQQPDTGSWWNVVANTAPTSITPKAPAAGMTLDSIVGITPQAALIAWAPKTTDGRTAERVTVVAYNLADGKELARTDANRGDVRTGGRAAFYNLTTGMTTAAGLVLTAGQPAQLIVVPGLRTTTIQDAVYGSTADADTVAIAPGTGPVELREGTVTPSGHTTDHLMVISQNNLYVLKPAAPRAVTSTGTSARVTVTKTVEKAVTRTVPTTVTVTQPPAASESSSG